MKSVIVFLFLLFCMHPVFAQLNQEQQTIKQVFFDFHRWGGGHEELPFVKEKGRWVMAGNIDSVDEYNPTTL